MHLAEEKKIIFSLLDEMESDLNSAIEHAETENREYDFWDDRCNRIAAITEEACDSKAEHRVTLNSLQAGYSKVKAFKQKSLEQSITNTLNTWYSGANYDMKFKFTSAGRAVHTFLVDENTGADLETACGGSAMQVAGLLNHNAILKSRDSYFLFLDEAFSNTDSVTATQLSETISHDMEDIQKILIENKTALSTKIDGLLYLIKYDPAEDCTKIIAIIDPYNEITEADGELYKIKCNTHVTLSHIFKYLEYKGNITLDGKYEPYTEGEDFIAEDLQETDR